MNYLYLLSTLLVLTLTQVQRTDSYRPQSGDIIFQTSRSSQSATIQKATHSPHSHMGIVFPDTKDPVVYEAVEPVRKTPLDHWIARGEGHHYFVKRLRHAQVTMTPAAVTKLRSVAGAFLGKHYDAAFEWSDDRMYCSEFVWKVYKRALDLEIGHLQRLSEFDLSDPSVQAKVRERWHGSPPANELVISPAQMFASELLETVHKQ